MYPPLASSRNLTSGYKFLTSRMRARSSAIVCFGSATLILTVENFPARPSTLATSLAGTAGKMALTGTCFLTGSGTLSKPHSIAACNQVAASSSLYSVKAAHSLQPLGPSNTSSSRSVSPRNLVRSGMLTTLAVATRSFRRGFTLLV